ncbi:MAG: 50S ribosomal protein L29 [Burkholderiaceae bacterium]|nr:50S ribosomal protein L29 [Burkholderiaceae bacterium]
MHSLKHFLAAGLIAGSSLAAFTVPAFADEAPYQQGFVHGSDYARWQMEQYHSEIAHMSADERSKLMAMQDKLMQMEMEHATAKLKMDMELAKARRDIEMYIYSTHHGRGQDVNN